MRNKRCVQEPFRDERQEDEVDSRGTMAGLQWIQTALNVMLVLHFTAVPGQVSSLIFRLGDEATLPCGNITDQQVKCDRTTWSLTKSIYSSVDLVVLGRTQSDRFRVTENCSLVLKNVSHEDAGLYMCRQVNTSGRRQDPTFSLSVVSMTEQEVGEDVTLTCSVSSYGDFRGKVRWLFKGNPVEKGHGELKTSQSGCSATVSFLKTHFISNDLDNFKCEVTNSSSGNKQQFTFSPRSSGKKGSSSGDKETTSDKTTGGSWWSIIAMTSAALILTVVVLFIIRRKRRRNNGRKTAENKAEESVSYTSITLPPSCSNTVRGGDDTVIYSMANAPSDDPPHVYATIN